MHPLVDKYPNRLKQHGRRATGDEISASSLTMQNNDAVTVCLKLDSIWTQTQNRSVDVGIGTQQPDSEHAVEASKESYDLTQEE